MRINSNVPWRVHPSSRIIWPHNIIRHDEKVWIGASPGCYIQAVNGIELGKNILIGPGVSIVSSNHNMTNFKKHDSAKPIVIGDNCWLGAGAIILPGVHLSEHTIVAAGAVVKEDSPPNSVMAGIPARVIKTIPPYDESE